MLELDLFDTRFWNKRIAKGDELPVITASCDCACILLPATDQAAIHQAEELGAEFMDFRVEYARDTAPEVGIARPIRPSDLDALARLAGSAFRGLTRFYADPRFPDERCDDLYEGWFRENVAGLDCSVLTIGDGERPAGFVTVKMDDPEASIILIAVAEHARGRGMGTNLARAAVNHAHEMGVPRISVVTQGCNIPAQRAFQNAGFRIVSSDVWLHKHYDPK